MSQNNNFLSVNENSTSSSSFNNDIDEKNQILLSNLPDELNNDNDDWKSADDNHDIDINEIQDDLITVNNEQNNNDGWANFDTFENNTDPKSQIVPVTVSNLAEDDWANFKSNPIQFTQHDLQLSSDKQSTKINHDDDVFGDYGEVQICQQFQGSSLPINSLNTESIKSLISTCFPLESSILSKDIDNYIPFELPSFTTYKDQSKQLPCFEHCLSLWKLLSNISNDPIGIQYQWRKSNIEHLFHQALGVHERFRTKPISLTSQSEFQMITSNVNNENKVLPQTMSPHFDWKQSGLENPLTNNDSSSLSINSNQIEENLFDVNKTLDLDYYISPIRTSTSNKREHITSSTIIHRNNSPILQQNATPIKTIDLFPGSTRVLNDDTKPDVDSVSNFSFMNPKALMLRTKN
ncbi:unnamed protein product [Rotaria sordida]|uniref:Uncharacterized protein n=1 Tax=Rotaria sordida TaxID=392033 RepID=A0A814AXN5_9BILA|nr:unnamed protein product [Rotaria sordida]CAF1414432.1 unnamed protein product [Rotaria sordida]